MKKICAFLIVLALFVLCFPTNMVFAESSQNIKIYLGKNVEKINEAEGVYQTNAVVSLGQSSVKFAYEEPSANKFLRLANFDATGTNNSTSVTLKLNSMPQVDGVLSFNYRLFEGDSKYFDTDVVIKVTFRGSVKEKTFSSLNFNKNVDYSWNSLSIDFTSNQYTSQYVTIEFFYEENTTYSSGKTCLDIDNVSFTANKTNYCTVGNFEFASVSSSETLDTDIEIGGNVLAEKSAYLLKYDEKDYRVNTTYSHTFETHLNVGEYSQMLARSGSSKIYRGAASVGRGEGDDFVIFDPYSNNSFLRMGNFNGTTSTQTAFVNYWHNNDTDVTENMPKSEYLYYSFKYRLYMDDEVVAKVGGKHSLFEFSVRSSTFSNSGRILLEEFVINEPGDETWHEKKGVVLIATSSTASLSVLFNSGADAKYNITSFIDLDNFYMGIEENGRNYTYHNGDFEGMAGESKGLSSDMLSELSYNSSLGSSANYFARNSLDGELELRKGATFTLGVEQDVASNVFNVNFETDAVKDEKIKVYFGGRSGESLELTVGQNVNEASGKYSVGWEKVSSGYKCFLNYVREDNTKLKTIDFVNSGSNIYRIDEIFVGQVSGVEKTAGDYQAYSSTIEQLFSNLSNYNEATQKTLNVLKIQANKLTEYSSQSKLDAMVSKINTAIANGDLKADLTELKSVIGQANSILENGDSAYTKGSWLAFTTQLARAKAVSENDSQEVADQLVTDLRSAMANLTYADTSVVSSYKNAIIAGASTLGTGAVTLGTIMFIKKKKEGKNENK